MNVKPVHQTLRDEVVESRYLSRAQWANIVEVKAREYMKTKRVRKMKGVTKEHICAIILYCDITALCTAFSATFRRENVFETLEAMKRRHAHFAIWARSLVELVLKFGINGYVPRYPTGGDDYETGPFFCGLDRIFNVGSFAITLQGPCSTSKVRTVALNFATKQGTILTLDNDTYEASQQMFFDCSWISNYFEEAERLWIGGYDPLRIVSIVIVSSAKDYRRMMRALFLFDAMISGVWMADCNIKLEAADCKLIQKLIESESKFDEYVTKEWCLFLQSKEEIMLDLYEMQREFHILSSLVVSDLVRYEVDEAAKGNNNVLKTEWISIFPAVHTVNINTRKYYFKFRLEALLVSMKTLPRSVGTVIVEDDGEWANEALTEDIKSLFAEFGWTAEYQVAENEDDSEQIGELVFQLKSV